MALPRRTYKEELGYIEQLGEVKYKIKKGFVRNMNVDGIVYVNSSLRGLLFRELKYYASEQMSHKSLSGDVTSEIVREWTGGFLPAVKQLANVAALPGIVGHSIGLPDVHSGNAI